MLGSRGLPNRSPDGGTAMDSRPSHLDRPATGSASARPAVGWQLHGRGGARPSGPPPTALGAEERFGATRPSTGRRVCDGVGRLLGGRCKRQWTGKGALGGERCYGRQECHSRLRHSVLRECPHLLSRESRSCSALFELMDPMTILPPPVPTPSVTGWQAGVLLTGRRAM